MDPTNLNGGLVSTIPELPWSIRTRLDDSYDLGFKSLVSTDLARTRMHGWMTGDTPGPGGP